MHTHDFQTALLDWFEREGRKHLPWQAAPTPYRVWVSEIMLQQTQVATVIAYFQRFMQRFPTLPDLAAAAEEAVLEHWAGLGYYARARNLHKAAQTVVRDYGGALPADLDRLVALPGIGRSTAGAILSLGFGQRAAILDGNVKRVLSRYAAVEGWPGDAQIARELWHLSEALTPSQRSADYNQAMMDLGATLCTRSRPACPRCPLRTGCQALALGLTGQLPTPRPRHSLPVRLGWMLVLRDAEGRFYLQKRPPSGIWGGLWAFPQFDRRDEAETWCALRGLPTRLQALPQRRHTFSHFHLDYTPLLAQADLPAQIAEAGAGWFNPQHATALPTPVRRLLAELA